MVISQGIVKMCLELRHVSTPIAKLGIIGVKTRSAGDGVFEIKPALVGWEQETIEQVADELRQRGVHLMNEDEWLSASVRQRDP